MAALTFTLATFYRVTRFRDFSPAVVAAIVIGPLLFFPCFFVASASIDTFFGEQTIVDHAIFVSKRDIWNQFWQDWAMALVPSYLVLTPLLAAASALRSKVSIWLTLPVAAIVAAIVAALFAPPGLPIVLSLAIAILYFVPATWILSKCPV